MCYRYFMEESPELRPFVEAARHSALGRRMVSQLGRPLVTSGEVRPTDIAVVSAPNQHGQRTVFPMVWGFSDGRLCCSTPGSRQPGRNRPSTVVERRRCIVPASGIMSGSIFSLRTERKDRGQIHDQPRGDDHASGRPVSDGRKDGTVPHFTILTRRLPRRSFSSRQDAGDSECPGCGCLDRSKNRPGDR